jgi:hypothetical protein
MYTLKDLDKPIECVAANFENLENGKECFHVVVPKALAQLDKIEVILKYVEKNLTGEPTEVYELLRKVNIINELSTWFKNLLDTEESRLINIIQPTTQTLPS